MYKFIVIVMWIILIVIPFIKPTFMQGANQSYNNYVRGLKNSFLFAWIALKMEGVEDNSEAFGFIVSICIYAILALLLSFFWPILIPIGLLILLTKKLLKKKS